MNVPKTPFSTCLSGNAKETELRIRSIFQWKKKRPPVVVILLTALAVLLCFGLVSCKQAVPEELMGNVEQWLDESLWIEASDLVSEETRWVLEEVKRTNRRYELAGVRGQIYEIICQSESGALKLTATLLVDPGTLEIIDVESQMISGKEETPSDRWIYEPSTDPLETVRSVIEGQGEKDYTNAVQVLSLAEDETEIDVDTLENLNLDGMGGNDDSLIVTTVRPHDVTESYASMTVRLGTGQELEHKVMGGYFCNGVYAPYLTSTERQTIVLELAFWGANWAGCNDFLFEVRNGVLAEVCTLSGDDAENALNAQSTLYGLEVIEREDSPLQALRVPTSVGKWHGPDIGTLTWEDDQWKFVTDGYYTDDWYWAVVDGGMELTISLRGRIDWETPSYPIWYYDQIQILHGETVIQTITENSFTPDDHCPFDFFNADVPNRSVFVRDINFDGNDDFGVPCNRHHNDGYCWFLYDPQLRQFRYAFSLSGDPVLVSDQKQIIETWQDDCGENVTYNTYEYNGQGELTLVESRKEAE